MIARLEGIQKLLAMNLVKKHIKFELKLQKDLGLVLKKEELLWYKKSRKEWIK